MLIFVSGGSASGKSALAERLCAALPGEHLYVATMPVRTDEDRRKVARHHALRAGRGFRTLEAPDRLPEVPPDAAVLLECLSTYTANRMFSGEPPQNWHRTLGRELLQLVERPGDTVIVSADVGADGADYGAQTGEYRRVLTALGVLLCERAEVAVEAVCGAAKVHKGRARFDALLAAQPQAEA